MSEVNLMIHGRTYGVGCDEGQERRVRELGAFIDRHMRDMAAAAGTSATEAHLLVLAALVMADELFDLKAAAQGQEDPSLQGALHQLDQENKLLRNNAAVLQSQLNETQTLLARARQDAANAQAQLADVAAQNATDSAAPAPANDLSPEVEAEITGAIQSLADRVAAIAKRMQAAGGL
jgi:cell division protein ZapA (FtsZ GTPase activity inhibitor)